MEMELEIEEEPEEEEEEETTTQKTTEATLPAEGIELHISLENPDIHIDKLTIEKKE